MPIDINKLEINWIVSDKIESLLFVKKINVEVFWLFFSGNNIILASSSYNKFSLPFPIIFKPFVDFKLFLLSISKSSITSLGVPGVSLRHISSFSHPAKNHITKKKNNKFFKSSLF